MNKEEFRLKVKKWFMDYFNLDEEKASEGLKYYEDYINNAIENEEEARIDVENHMRYIVGAIKHIEGGADEEKEFGTLTYMLGIA